MNEEWKEYPLNKDYLVSTTGRVLGWYKNKSRRRELKPDKNKIGYYSYHVQIDGKKVNKLAHRIVAETFLQNPDGLPDVDHIDMNRANNNVENLRWASHADNCQKRKYKTPIGIPARQVISIDKNNNIKHHKSMTEAAKWIYEQGKAKGIPGAESNICQAARTGRTSYGFRWRYYPLDE